MFHLLDLMVIALERTTSLSRRCIIPSKQFVLGPLDFIDLDWDNG